MPGKSSAVNIVVFAHQDSGLRECHSRTCINEIKLSHKIRNTEWGGGGVRQTMRQIKSVPITWVKFALEMQLKLTFAKRNKKDKGDDAWHLRVSDTFRMFSINLILNHSVLAMVYSNTRSGKNGKWFNLHREFV